MKLIVSDASPLIVIARSGLVPVLRAMVTDVIIPEAVFAECTFDLALPGALAVKVAVTAGDIQVRPDVEPAEQGLVEVAYGLGTGELAAIRLAKALQCPVLMDERLGREAARRQGLAIIGSAGLLLAAKERGLISAVGSILDQWRQSGYLLSPTIIRAVLERAGEL